MALRDQRLLEKAARSAFKGLDGNSDISHLAGPLRVFEIAALKPRRDRRFRGADSWFFFARPFLCPASVRPFVLVSPAHQKPALPPQNK
jgi:hypothetical protein